MEKTTQCTLTNEQLIEKASEWIKKLCESGGREWCLRVPAESNHDPDLIFSELAHRLGQTAALQERVKELEGEWVSVEERLPIDVDNVLIFADKGGENIDVAFYDPDDKEWKGLNSIWVSNIKFWRPLPPPPEK